MYLNYISSAKSYRNLKTANFLGLYMKIYLKYKQKFTLKSSIIIKNIIFNVFKKKNIYS